MHRRKRRAGFMGVVNAALPADWGRGKRHVPGFTIGRLPIIDVDQRWVMQMANDFQPVEKLPPVRKQSAFTDGYNFGNALERRGFKRLGFGHYSDVFGKDGYDRVIKVTRHEDNWIDYVLWGAKKGYAGKFVPRVYSYKRFKGDFRVAVMERLDRTLRQVDRKEDMKLVGTLVDFAMQNNTMAAVFLDELQPGLAEFIREFDKTFGCRDTDFHNGNWMTRGDKIVLTDPVCGSSEVTQTRLKAGDFSPVIRGYYEVRRILERMGKPLEQVQTLV